MKIQVIHVVMAAVLCLSIVDKVNAGRRRPVRQKCFLRLCMKCSMLLNTRYKRSIADGENEFDTVEDFEVDNTDGLPKPKAENLQWLDGYSQQDEFDVESANIHSIDKTPASPKSKDIVPVHSPKSPVKRKRKRASSSFERCIYLLNTKCCRAYYNVATYIGLYKLRH